MENFTWNYLRDYAGKDIRLQITNRTKIKFNIIEALSKTVVWQTDAKLAIARAIENAWNPLFDKKWTLWNFFFYGPSGTWKTQLVKATADLLYWDPKGYTHVNCERFQWWHEVSSLFWAPPSYIGFDKKPLLAQSYVDRPYKKAEETGILPYIWTRVRQIALFDEIEKAHSDLHTGLMSVLDEWVVYMNNGQRTDFSRALIFMTSNIGEKEAVASKPVWFNAMDSVESVKDELRLQAIQKLFPPEFIGRLDWMFKFVKLWTKEKRQILINLYEKLLADCYWLYDNIFPIVTDSVYEYLLDTCAESQIRNLERKRWDVRTWLGNVIGSNALEYEKAKIIITIDCVDWRIIYYVDGENIQASPNFWKSIINTSYLIPKHSKLLQEFKDKK